MRLLEMLFVSSSDNKYMWLDKDVADKNFCVTWIMADRSQKLVFAKISCIRTLQLLLLLSANYPSH
jgi:hypothetical protein